MIISTEIWAWVIIPLLIFIARILDVSIGTIRVILISKGVKWLAPILGFFEVLIWLMAIKQILTNISNFMGYLAYGAGFAAGTYIGMLLEEKIRIGKVVVRVITRTEAKDVVETLRAANYPVTTMKAQGRHGPVTVIFTVVKRETVQRVIDIIHKFNPRAFYTIEDVRYV
ncbi:MAG: DUF2179 domain-containing protein, partial [Nanoarchaeota archaeon]|nr:DUF2179 domain-containing protein [Nanoarchaeota archaeon]